jgi:hypothetical protein
MKLNSRCAERDTSIPIFTGGITMGEKKTNWGVIIGVVIATVAVLAVGAVLAVKLLKKKKACCCDDELCDEDICVLDEELEIEAE